MNDADKKQVLEILRSLETTIAWLDNTFRFQFLENADSAEFQIKSVLAPESVPFHIVETMLKAPMRRGLGKVRGVLGMIRECINIISKP